MNLEKSLTYVAAAVDKYASEIDNKYYVDTSYYDFQFGNLEGAILYSLIRACGAKNIFDFGTRNGGSTVFCAAAAEKNDGFVTTIDAVDVGAKERLESLGLTKIAYVVKDQYEIEDYRAFRGPIEFVLYDADHSDRASEWVINFLMPKTHNWFVMHDIFCDQPTDYGRRIIFDKFKDNVDMISVGTIMSRTSFRPPEKHGFACQNSSAYFPLMKELQ